MPNTVNFDEFQKPEACGQTVLPDMSKIGEKCQNRKSQIGHFG